VVIKGDFVAKSKRSNYLIDKPFQLGFIVRYVLIILLTMSTAFGVSALYYFWDSMWGENKLDSSVNFYRKGQMTTASGNKIYHYDKEKIQVYESKDENGNVVYKVASTFGNNKFEMHDELELNQADLEKVIGAVLTVTTRFNIVIYPLLWTSLAMIFLISVYSLFFSHKMAGPIYRLRVSLDRMIAGDYDFRIKARKSDFFLNIVEKLELLRIKIYEEKETGNK